MLEVLDLYCKAGGAAMGVHQALEAAGIPHNITGVDIEPQHRYPFNFVLADAMTYDLDGYDFIWASPPCQAYSSASANRRAEGYTYPELVWPTERRLLAHGKPFCMENVPAAPMHRSFMLCGTMFGMRTLRHRIFHTNFKVIEPVHPKHLGKPKDGVYVTVAGGGAGGGNNANVYSEWAKVMRIDWMTKKELANAVPPDYSRYIIEQWLQNDDNRVSTM